MLAPFRSLLQFLVELYDSPSSPRRALGSRRMVCVHELRHQRISNRLRVQGHPQSMPNANLVAVARMMRIMNINHYHLMQMSKERRNALVGMTGSAAGALMMIQPGPGVATGTCADGRARLPASAGILYKIGCRPHVFVCLHTELNAELMPAMLAEQAVLGTLTSLTSEQGCMPWRDARTWS